MAAKKSNRQGDERGVYVISIAAELAGVHPQTLRMYERRGLLRPERTSGSSRRYSDRDVEHVRLIQQLTQQRGVNLAGVEMVMGLTRQLEDARNRLAAMEHSIEQMRNDMQEEIERVRRSFRAELVPLRNAIVPFNTNRRSETTR